MENYHNMIKKFFHKGNVMPKISVIIPVYNVEQYLPQCLDSLRKQTLSDLEFICINDGSVDGSLDILQAYAAEDHRFVIINQKNRGQGYARNKGLEAASGEYIGFVDGDDWVDEDMYETLYHLIYEHQADISICTHYTELPNRTKVKYKSKKTKIFSSQKAIATLIEDKIIQNYIWEKLFKRELFTELRFPVGWSFEDIALCYKIFHKARKIVLLQTPKYHYRTRPGSITNSTRNPLKEFQYLQALHGQFQFAAENNIKVRKPKKLVQKTFHFINHIIILPPSSLKNKYINDAFEIAHTYDYLRNWEIGVAATLRRFFVYNYFNAYASVIITYRKYIPARTVKSTTEFFFVRRVATSLATAMRSILYI